MCFSQDRELGEFAVSKIEILGLCICIERPLTENYLRLELLKMQYHHDRRERTTIRGAHLQESGINAYDCC
jgi:hypothetical protein